MIFFPPLSPLMMKKSARGVAAPSESFQSVTLFLLLLLGLFVFLRAYVQDVDDKEKR